MSSYHQGSSPVPLLCRLMCFARAATASSAPRHRGDDRVQSGGSQIMPNRTVGQQHDTVGVGGSDGVVRDHYDGLSGAGHCVAQQPQNLRTRGGVEVARRFVGEGHLRTCDQSPRDCHALPLATGHLAGSVRQAIGDAHRLHHVVEPRLVGFAAREVERQADVLRCGEGRDEVEGLEDEADPVTAQPGEGVVAERAEFLVPDAHRTGGRVVEARQQVQQRGLRWTPCFDLPEAQCHASVTRVSSVCL